jgi:hypothetical protein
MAVIVVEAHADDRQPSVHGGQEGGVGVGRAVVRHLQHVGAQIGAGVEQRLLRLDLGVAGQHDPYPVDDRTEHERGVVRVGPGAVEGRRRAEHVQVHRTDVEVGADRRGAHL